MTRANQALLSQAFREAVRAVDPEGLVRSCLVREGDDPVVVRGGRVAARLRGPIRLVAAGKAAAGMVRGALPAIRERLVGAVVAVPAPVRFDVRGLHVFVGGHPVPGGGSVAAGRAAWSMLGDSGAGEAVLVLLSGGASSLLALPAPGVTLADKVRTTSLLLRAGATIAETNAVRKHLSRLKGGGLVRRAGAARVVCLLVSDVIGNAPAVVGSGPAAADPTTFEDAWRVLRRYGLERRVPPGVRRRLERGMRGDVEETLGPGRGGRYFVLGDVKTALSAAAEWARGRGFEPRIWTSSLRGDTRAAARRFAAEVRRVAARARRDVCVLAGGETTVEVRGGGRGGRNLEFALVLAGEISGSTAVACLSAGSDGIDGPTDAAGAFVDGVTLRRARRLGLDPGRFLERNDSWTFFHRLGDLFRPGPTGTNVMDLKIALVRAPRGRG